MSEQTQRVQATVQEALLHAERYFETTNNILGVLAVTVGLSCLSAENVKFYAWLSSVFLVLAWGASFEGYRRRLKMLKMIGHRKMSTWYIIKRCYVALLSWAFLGAIAIGYLDKTGWKGV
jgi:hypothetical protein